MKISNKQNNIFNTRGSQEPVIVHLVFYLTFKFNRKISGDFFLTLPFNEISTNSNASHLRWKIECGGCH